MGGSSHAWHAPHNCEADVDASPWPSLHSFLLYGRSLFARPEAALLQCNRTMLRGLLEDLVERIDDLNEVMRCAHHAGTHTLVANAGQRNRGGFRARAHTLLTPWPCVFVRAGSAGCSEASRLNVCNRPPPPPHTLDNHPTAQPIPCASPLRSGRSSTRQERHRKAARARNITSGGNCRKPDTREHFLPISSLLAPPLPPSSSSRPLQPFCISRAAWRSSGCRCTRAGSMTRPNAPRTPCSPRAAPPRAP